MFGVLGFAVDIGFGEFRKHAQQVAADSAAMAAASYAAANGSSCSSGVSCGGSATNCSSVSTSGTPFYSACGYAKTNGYTSNATPAKFPQVTILANNTSSPVSGNSPALWFQVTISDQYFTLFGGFGGVPSLTMHTTSVAGVNTTGGGNCIISLSTSGTGFSDSGSGNVTTTGCGIYDNSNLSYSGSGNITAQTIQYIGTYSPSGSGNVSPAPASTTAAMSDPFLNVPSPTVGSCTNPNSASGLSYPLVISDSSSHTIQPGTYCGGIDISGSGNITFTTGTYIINGTDSSGNSFDYTGSGNLGGANVMFFITGQNTYTAGPLNVAGSGNLTFSAPSSGSYEGILFYQDRNITPPYATANSYSGSGNVTGSFYFPTTSLSYSGSGNASYTALVANTISLSGSGNFTFKKDTNGQYTGLVRTTPSLIQ